MFVAGYAYVGLSVLLATKNGGVFRTMRWVRGYLYFVGAHASKLREL